MQPLQAHNTKAATLPRNATPQYAEHDGNHYDTPRTVHHAAPVHAATTFTRAAPQHAAMPYDAGTVAPKMEVNISIFVGLTTLRYAIQSTLSMLRP